MLPARSVFLRRKAKVSHESSTWMLHKFMGVMLFMRPYGLVGLMAWLASLWVIQRLHVATGS